jgi:putative addiction module component (TIGR02574 family)
MVHSADDFDFTALSTVERLQLAQALLESVLQTDANPFTPEQMAELQRRIDDIDAGRGSFETW